VAVRLEADVLLALARERDAVPIAMVALQRSFIPYGGGGGRRRKIMTWAAVTVVTIHVHTV